MSDRHNPHSRSFKGKDSMRERKFGRWEGEKIIPHTPFWQRGLTLYYSGSCPLNFSVS